MQFVLVDNLGDEFDVGVSVPSKIGVTMPTKTHGQAVKASFTSITAAANVFQDMLVSVALPNAGTYLICWQAHTVSLASMTITTRLYDVTQDVAIDDSERVGTGDGTGNHSAPSAGSHIVTVDGPTTIRLEAARTAVGTAVINSNVQGRTVMTFVKLA